MATLIWRTSEVKIGHNGIDVTVVDDLNVGGDCGIAGDLQVGPAGGAAAINAAGNPVGMPLNIGAAATTTGVNIGRNGQQVSIADDLLIGGDCDLAGALLVGPAGAAGAIDSGGSAVTPRGLSIGTTNVTGDVTIGRAGTDVIITDDLSVSGKLIVNGHVEGFGGNQIDFDDEVHTNEALFIEAGGQCDGAFTFNALLDIDAITRLNSNGLVLDGAANPAAGCGIIYNPNGHANPAIDFFAGGEFAGWMDEDGFHAPA